MRFSGLVLLLCVLVPSFWLTAQPARTQGEDDAAASPRFALLIGNADYDQNGVYTPTDQTQAGRLPDLRNPCNDVILIEERLIRLGWDEESILRRCDQTEEQIFRLTSDFAHDFAVAEADKDAAPPVGFIYYTGHGVQIGSDSYIFAVDTLKDIETAARLFERNPNSVIFQGGFRLRSELINRVGWPGRGTLFLVLDACRNNPVIEELQAQGITVPISGPRPLNERRPGLKLLFSTAEGELASDGAASNSPFATIFARNMIEMETVDHLIRAMVSDVFAETSDPQKRRALFTPLVQLPAEEGSLHKPPPEACLKEECG